MAQLTVSLSYVKSFIGRNNVHNSRNKNKRNKKTKINKIKRQKPIEQELGCKDIRFDLKKENFDIFIAINEIFRHIKQWNKKTLINKVSTRLLGLDFRSNNIIKSKAMKLIVKKYCLIISKIVWFYLI